ncbi:MAG TPA: hypothetical protein VGM56_11955 [Byssovorax sp.]
MRADHHLGKVLAERDDDAPRRAYADAIEATDATRAAFVRAQCALAAADRLDAAAAEHEARVAAARASEAWDADLRAIPDAFWVYGRGFVDSFGADPATLVAHAALLAGHPVTSFAMALKQRDGASLAASGVLTQARRLSLSGAGKAIVEVLASNLPHLRALTLATSASTLARVLDLDAATNLRELWIDVTDDADAAARAIAEAPSLTRLTRLRFRAQQAACGVPGHRGPAPPGPASDDAIARIARSPHLAALEALQLGAVEGARGARAIGERGDAALKELVVDDIDEEAGLVLAASALMHQLERLEMGFAGRRAALALAENRGATRLRALSIAGLLQTKEPIGDEGLAALARAPQLQGVMELDIGSCGVGPAGVAAVADAEAFPRLRSLTVFGGRDLGAAGFEALARWASSSELHTLYAPLEDEGAAQAIAPLLASPAAARLRRLDLYGPTLERGDAVIRAIADAHMPKLTHLAMARHVNAPSFLTGGARALLTSTSLPRLTILAARLLKVSKATKDALRARFAVLDSQGLGSVDSFGVSGSSARAKR